MPQKQLHACVAVCRIEAQCFPCRSVAWPTLVMHPSLLAPPRSLQSVMQQVEELVGENSTIKGLLVGAGTGGNVAAASAPAPPMPFPASPPLPVSAQSEPQAHP